MTVPYPEHKPSTFFLDDKLLFKDYLDKQVRVVSMENTLTATSMLVSLKETC